jgi:CRISPR system Cascade subunit CasA
LNGSGEALVWLLPWDGTDSLSFNTLDPFYIEICRRIRLFDFNDRLAAYTTSSRAARIEAKQLNGQTGDPWTPINVAEGKALTVGAKGFDYKLASELVFGSGTYRQPIAQQLRDADGSEGIVILAQAVTRGQGKTEGYHERRIPISPKVRRMLRQHQTDQLAATASTRVKAIGDMRNVLWVSLVTLFNNGSQKSPSDETKNKANRYTKPFELGEDHRFFTDLNTEIEAENPKQARLEWLAAMAQRAEAILMSAFEAGPRCNEQRYRARAAALSRFHGTLRGEKSPLPDLANHYRKQVHKRKTANDAA